MKTIVILFILIGFINNYYSQTVLINPSSDGGFETGTTFAANGWSTANASTNIWTLGNAPGGQSGLRCAYISNAGDGGSWSYTNSTLQTSHFYKSVTFPAGQTYINLSFKWKCQGESGYDRIYVYTNTSIPTAGTPASSTSSWGTAVIVGGPYNSNTAWQTVNISLPGTLAGTTQYLIFTWQNDGSLGTNPPGAIDDISLTAQAPYLMSNTPITTCSGQWLDDGGLANYTSNDYTQTFTPGSVGMNLQFTFTSWTMGDADDYLIIYDGPNTSSPIIGTYNNTTGSPGTITATNSTGQLTFLWFSDNNGLDAGWQANISCVTPPPSNDNCSGAIPLTVSSTCTYSTYSNVSASATTGVPAPGCANYIDDDVWFSVIVPDCGHLNFDTQTGSITDGGMAIYSGNCSSLTLIECDDDDSPNGSMPMIDRTGLTPGSTVYIRFWEYGGDVQGTFGICVKDMEPPCSGTPLAGTISATPNSVSCPNTSVTLNSTGYTIGCNITYLWQSSLDNSTWSDIIGANTIPYSLVVTSQSYYRLKIVCLNSGIVSYSSSVQVNVLGSAPINDDPCNAIILNVGTNGQCSYQTFTNNCSSGSSGIYAPGCASYSSGDVWFQATVPASGRLIVDLSANGGLTDMGMAWYQGTCSDLSAAGNLIECDDDDSQNGAMPMICRTGTLCTVPGDCAQNGTLTPGSIVYIRVWDYSGNETGTFDICAYEPTNPGAPSLCSNAQVISSLPFSALNETTCCRGNEYTSANICASSYMDGEDFLYQYTPSSNQSIDITLTGTSSYTGIFVIQGCPDQPSSSCIASNTSSSGNPHLCGVSLSSGITYYIMIDTDPTPTCTPFNIQIYPSSAPSCGLNYTLSSISYSPDPHAGTNVGINADDRFASSYSPIGFTFCFDGINYTRCLISSNGYIIFDPIGCASNLPSSNAAPDGTSGWSISSSIPNTSNAPRNCIMFPWHDIDPSLGSPEMKYQTIGTAPNRRFVVSFQNIPMFGSSCSGITYTGQVKLFETTNNIEVHIANKQYCSGWNGGAAILGIHNYNGTQAIVPTGYNYPTQWNSTNQAWRFTSNCTICTTPLPINLISFKANCLYNDNIELEWITSSEINNDYFLLYKSYDATNFILIDKIKANGNNNSTITYKYTYYEEYFNRNVYYKLEQVDFNGDVHSFDVISNNCLEQNDEYIITPNPSYNGYFNIKGLKPNDRVQIINSIGKSMLNNTKLDNGIYGIFVNNKFIGKLVVKTF
ncbi:MAG: hypothetical protein HPY79_12210 [Bacteroidales bacterium]|nr:hypothetical protein [Bacteroidales bacterium]